MSTEHAILLEEKQSSGEKEADEQWAEVANVWLSAVSQFLGHYDLRTETERSHLQTFILSQ